MNTEGVRCNDKSIAVDKSGRDAGHPARVIFVAHEAEQSWNWKPTRGKPSRFI